MIGLLARTVSRLRRRHEGPLPVEPGPSWPDTRPLSLDACRDAFERVTPGTIGVEEELLLVLPDTLDLAGANREILEELGTDGYFHPELRAAQIEIVTPVCRSAAEVAGELLRARHILTETIRGRYRLVAAGTHPFAQDWGEISDAERYRLIEDEYSWAARRSLACGLHVHVAVGGADRSLAVYNALRSYLPEVLAVAANSPFLEGEDTGLCTVRPRLIGSLPRTGIPPAFPSWADFIRFLGWARTAGLFPDATFLWWDLRPHPVYGTLELRAADCQTRVEDAGAIAALVHCLAARLADRHGTGERLAVHPTHWISENAWRALRYGVAGHLVDLDTGRREPTRSRLARLVDDLSPTAERLGCSDELAGVRVLIAGNGADRQRYVAEREGLVGLVAWLARETERA